MGLLKKYPAIVTGLGITILFLCLSLLRVGFLDTVEYKLYDTLMGLRSDPAAQTPVVMVDIDDDSIEKLGRWPWPRSYIAAGIQKINVGNPKVIGLNFILSEPEEIAGLEALRQLEALYAETVLPFAGDQGIAFLQAISDAAVQLDHDTALAETIQDAGNVVLPIFFKTSAIVGEQDKVPQEALLPHAVKVVSSTEDAAIPTAGEVILPIGPFLDTSAGLGHINLAYDMDGTARRERLLYGFGDLFVPSYTLRLAANFLNVPADKIQVDLGAAITMGMVHIETTRYSELLINFKGPRGAFKSYAYFDLLNDKIPPSVFKNKLVLVSASASGIINPLSTPTDATMPLGEFSAHAVTSILTQQYIKQPAWSEMAELGMILFVGILIAFLLPRFKAMIAGVAFWLLLILMGGGAAFSFVSEGLWVPVTYPLLQLILGYIGVVSIKYFVTETSKEKAEGESAETNRMLGVSFQSQGMLDMAFDKFRRVPVDDEMKDILYNLALDYERKRQLNKAASVFEYIEEHDAKFKDVVDRKSKLIQVSETMVFGDGFLGGGGDDGLLGTSTGTRPTLGRYEVIKQLGKGAMGIVYLGKDPRINRTTAIKTFRFSDDIAPEETEKMKQKFFREAESAGTLSHPNIVTIYDAGDEQDLAFIAMEFLEGEDLEKYTKKDSLFSMRKVIAYMADIAEALGYAHDRGIVHRDIKPANIMLLKSGVVKITDFGIARITATSQTQTGVVKGTPYYMSPEQFSGEKVDGRSDIFSLGTMTYQLLTGELPFFGESPPALMHQIMNVSHPDPRKINPKIVKPLVTIMNKALEKDKDKRYQKAATMSAHLKQLGKKIDMAIAKKKMQQKPD